LSKINKQRLGRGLSALLPSIDTDKSDNRIKEIDPKLIKTNPYQPRLEFDEVALEELKNSIREKGLIQPIAVRQIDNYYELIAGERRLRSVIDLNFEKVPVYILEVETKEDMLEIALIENVQREKLNVIELAISYKRLVDECSYTIENVAKKIGKDRSTINNIIRLLKLPNEVQDAIKGKKISMGHARALLAAEKTIQLDLLKKIILDDLSVRKVEALIKSLNVQKVEEKTTKTSSPKKSYHVQMENLFRGKLGTQVKLSPKSKGGSIEIEYYSDEDLTRIYDLFELIKES
jgi:ParB family chromosome partitioning protein